MFCVQAGTAPMPGLHVSAALPIQPLAMEILDSLSVHSKMSLLHHIVTHILKLANTKSQAGVFYILSPPPHPSGV